MMPMQNSLAERLSGMGMQPPGPAATAQPGLTQNVAPQGMPPANNTFQRPVMRAPGMAQPQMQPQQPMQNNLRRMIAY
jgi:hypothetical protein